jgi:ankyrin repeat protein
MSLHSQPFNQLLLFDQFQSGANVNAQNNNGVTPLMDACEAGAVDVIQFLLDSGRYKPCSI